MTEWRTRDRLAALKAEAEAHSAAFQAKMRADLWNEIIRAADQARETGQPVRCDLLMLGCNIVLTPE